MTADFATRPTIHRAGASTVRAPDGIATGPFWVEMLVEGCGNVDITAMRATLDPGIITHWHTHPHGQVLYALSVVGRVRRDGEAAVELRVGDCAWFAPGERHWHGAAPDSVFSYISIQPVQNGTAVHWLEPVTDEEARS